MNESTHKGILKPSTAQKPYEILGGQRNTVRRRGPTAQFRQRGTFFKPVQEMFLCYGAEEFFDCRATDTA